MVINMNKLDDFIGKWQITEIEQYDQFDNEDVGYIEFSKNYIGEIYIGCMSVELDYRFVKDKKGNVVDFTFEGSDECEPICGRGSVIMVSQNLIGQLYIHRGEEIGFIAKRYKIKSA